MPMRTGRRFHWAGWCWSNVDGRWSTLPRRWHPAGSASSIAWVRPTSRWPRPVRPTLPDEPIVLGKIPIIAFMDMISVVALVEVAVKRKRYGTGRINTLPDRPSSPGRRMPVPCLCRPLVQTILQIAVRFGMWNRTQMTFTVKKPNFAIPNYLDRSSTFLCNSWISACPMSFEGPSSGLRTWTRLKIATSGWSTACR